MKLQLCYICSDAVVWLDRNSKIFFIIDMHEIFNDHCSNCGDLANCIYDDFLSKNQ